MSELTISEAAEKALKSLAKPSSAEELYAEILRLGLYIFNTPTPIHVLQTELKRYLVDSPRSDSYGVEKFQINPDKKYSMATSEPGISKRTQSVGMKRILRASDKEELIEELMSARIGIFREIWRLLLFTAQIGLNEKRREPLKSVEAGKGIDQATFGNSASWPGILYLMGLAESGDSEVLASSQHGEEQRVLLFQEFANGGLSIIKEFFNDRTVDLDGVLSFIETHQVKANELEALDLDLSI